MRDYEVLLVISPEVEEEAVAATVKRVHDFIQGRGGEVVQVDDWGRRRLAYPIKQHQEGNYVVTQFRLDPTEVRDLEGSLQVSEDVLRHLVVKVGE